MTSEEPLRILHVTEVHWGGVVSLLDHFVREQVASGHEVHVLGPHGLPPLPAGAVVHQWGVDRSVLTSFPGAVKALRATVAETRPDVVHLHSFIAGALGRLPLGTAGIGHAAVVYQPHAWSDQLSSRPWFGVAIRSAERLFARQTSMLVTNGPDELARAESLRVRAPGTAVGVAVDLQRFRPPSDAERAEARTALGLGAEHVALVLARLSRQKGQDMLVPAWRASRPEGTVLALVGPGDPAELQELAGDEWGRTIVWYGEHIDVLPWLWASDVLVLSSRYEGLPIVVAEAMATGLPVVTTAVDGVTGILVGGELPDAGCVTPLDDMSALLREVGRRMNDAALRKRESAAGVARARELFAPATVTARLVETYRDAIDRRRGAT